MNFIYQYLPEGLVNAIGWTIFHSIWQGGAIALLLGIILFIMKNKPAHAKYIVAVSAIMIFVLVSVITFSIKYDSSLQAAPDNKAYTMPDVIDGIVFENPLAPKQDTETIFDTAKNYFRTNLALFVLAWFAGLMVFSLRFIGGVLHLQRIRTHGIKELDVEWLYRSRELSRKLGIQKFVYVYESAKIKIPLAIGYIKPVILLPLGMINGLPYTQVEAIIAHELAHIKRYDFLINLIQSFIETVFFYHPAIWWISNQIREERENCCDDLTIEICKDVLAYSKALYNLQHIKDNHPELALAANGNDNQLLRRIKRMNGEKSKLSYGGRFAALLFLFVFVAAVFIFSSSAASSKTKNINEASFVNPIFSGDETSSVKSSANFSFRDTTSIKKGKHTLKYDKEVNGEEKRFKAKLNNGKLEALYIDGDAVAEKDLDKYEKDVVTRADEYDNAMKEYRESIAEYKNNMKEHREKMRELRSKLHGLKADHSSHWDFDFPEHFSTPMMDSSEFREIMKNVRVNINKHFANKSFHIPPIHIPPIVIPPIPPINFDGNCDDFDGFDKEEFKNSMKEWGKELKESMKEFNLNMKENKGEWQKMTEEINKSINNPEFRKSMADLKANMGKLKADMKILKAYLRDVKDELINDGLIKEEEDLDGFYLSTKEMKVNGKKVSEDLHKKYLALYKKHYGKDLREDQKFNIED
jgi:bla regulator protein blaR1